MSDVSAQEASPFDLAMMAQALELAREAASLHEVPVGALVTCAGNVIGRGFNLREKNHDPTAHAEILAMRQASEVLGTWRLDECTLYVTLEPCCMCAGAIVNARIGRLVYGASDPKAGACESLYNLVADPRLNHRLPALSGVMARECGDVLKDFFRARRRTKDSEDTVR